MHADDLPARYREDEDFQAVALPYGGGRFELVAVLPRVGLKAPQVLRRIAGPVGPRTAGPRIELLESGCDSVFRACGMRLSQVVNGPLDW